MLQITRLPPRIHALGKKIIKKNLVDKKTASVSPLRHSAVKKKSYPESLQNFGMYLDYSRTKKGEKKKPNRARLSGSVCISDAVLYSERVSELRWEKQL